MNERESRSPLVRLTAWSAAHPVTGVAAAIGVLLLSIVSISWMRLDTSVHAMLGEGAPSAAALARLSTSHRASDELYVLASAPDGPSLPPGALTAFAERLQAAIADRPDAAALVSHVRWHSNPEFKRFARDVMLPAGVFYLTDAGWQEFLERLTPEGMRAQLARDEALMAAPGPTASALAERLVRDPLRLIELVPGAAEPAEVSGDDSLPERSLDGRTLLIRIGGVLPASDLGFAVRLCDAVKPAIARAGPAPLAVELAGSYAIAARTSRAIRTDSIATTLVSVALLHLLFALLYRRWLAPLVILGVAGLGITTGFGLHALFAPSITPLTAVIAAMLAGLGVDYGIHFLSHYQSHRAAGLSARDAAAATSGHLGLPIVTNCLTSVFGFASLWFSSVAMLGDFAVVGTLGLLGCLAATFTALPALLVLTDRAAGRLASSRFAWISAPAVRHPGLCMAVAGVLLAAVGIAATGSFIPELEADLTVMHPRPNRALELTNALSARFAGVPETIPVEITGPDPVAAAHRVARAFDTPALRGVGVIPEKTVGLHSLLPDPATTAARKQALESLNPQRVVAAFDTALNESIFDPAAFGEYREFLRTLVTSHDPPDIQDLAGYPAIAGRVLLGYSDGMPDRALLAVALDGPVTDRARREEIVGCLRSALQPHPEATLTGMTVVVRDLEQATRTDLPRSLVISFVLVLTWLGLVFRRPSDVALALIPLAFAILCTVGFLAISGQRFNPVNAVALPLLEGIAVDAGVFLVAASRAGPPGRAALVERFRTTGPAVLAAALTTVAGFGALVFARTPAIRSLGAGASVGILAAFLGAILLLMPLLLRRASRADPESAG